MALLVTLTQYVYIGALMSIVLLLHESCEDRMCVLEVTFRGRLLLCATLLPAVLFQVLHTPSMLHIE